MSPRNCALTLAALLAVQTGFVLLPFGAVAERGRDATNAQPKILQTVLQFVSETESDAIRTIPHRVRPVPPVEAGQLLVDTRRPMDSMLYDNPRFLDYVSRVA